MMRGGDASKSPGSPCRTSTTSSPASAPPTGPKTASRSSDWKHSGSIFARRGDCSASLHQHHPRLLEHLLERAQEVGGGGAVDDAVVGTDGEAHHQAGDDLRAADDGTLLGGADGEDAD